METSFEDSVVLLSDLYFFELFSAVEPTGLGACLLLIGILLCVTVNITMYLPTLRKSPP